jgi:conjugative transfer signal peptidase TraF
MTRHSFSLLGTAMVGITLVAIANPRAQEIRLVYSATASAPVGWFLVKQHARVRLGDFVLARLPQSAAELAHERGYLRFGTPIVKRVAAIEGQVACASGTAIRVDQVEVATALRHDRQGRPLSVWRGCRELVDEIFLLGDRSPSSFDSRYFGPVARSAIIGRVEPLWTW